MKVAALFLPLVVLLAGCFGGVSLGGGGGSGSYSGLVLKAPMFVRVGDTILVTAEYHDATGKVVPNFLDNHPYEWSYSGAATGDPGITLVNGHIPNPDGTTAASFQVSKTGTRYVVRLKVRQSATSSTIIADSTCEFSTL